MKTYLKSLIVGLFMAGLSLGSLAAIAAETEPPAPATEHQSDVLKKDKQGKAEGGTRKGATGSKEDMETRNPPATEHQERALKDKQETARDREEAE